MWCDCVCLYVGAHLYLCVHMCSKYGRHVVKKYMYCLQVDAVWVWLGKVRIFMCPLCSEHVVCLV